MTWEDFCACIEIEGMSRERKKACDVILNQCASELGMRNAEFFSGAMKRRDHWRLFEEFGGDAVCLDIETNGYQPWQGGYATVVGLYDGYDWKRLVYGEDLTAENLNRELSGYKLLITFFGTSFDIPFLLKSLPGARFDIPHFDLCHAAKRIGMSGGLKKLEEICGIYRDETLKGMNGYDAVKLWEAAQRGSKESLDLLLTYNRADTCSLLPLADIIYRKLKDSTGIEEHLRFHNVFEKAN